MRAFITFHKGMMHMSSPVRLWLLTLKSSQQTVPFMPLAEQFNQVF